MTETGPVPGTARWKVLETLNELWVQSYWSAPQIAARTELEVPTAIRALGWLRERELCKVVPLLVTDSMYEITPAGRRALEPQLSFDSP